MRFFKKRYLLLLLILFFLFVPYAPLGGNPAGDRLNRIQSSLQYNTSEKYFQNPKPITLSTGRPWTEIFYDFLFNGGNRRPAQKLPEDPSGLAALDNKSEEVRFIWFGHSTILLEIDAKRILIDPMFSQYASPVPFVAERFQPPVFNIEQIHNIDIVLISHDHYDHLDYETISQLKTRDIRFIVPLGVGAHLESWGIDNSNITELDWWEDTTFKDLKLTCTPAQHFSGRGINNRNSTLWASWSVQGQTQNIFFSGDSGYGDHYKEIGNRLGPFDLTFLENGAYSLDWKFVHQLPEEGIQAHLDLRGKAMVPVHWGMFDLSLHSWHEPIERVSKEAELHKVKLITPKLGQLVYPQQTHRYADWWTALNTPQP